MPPGQSIEPEILEAISVGGALLSRVAHEPLLEGSPRLRSKRGLQPGVDTLHLAYGIHLHVIEPDAAEAAARLPFTEHETARQVEEPEVLGGRP